VRPAEAQQETEGSIASSLGNGELRRYTNLGRGRRWKYMNKLTMIVIIAVVVTMMMIFAL
jgi:hypothetical protein